jgi:hypothetical protein
LDHGAEVFQPGELDGTHPIPISQAEQDGKNDGQKLEDNEDHEEWRNKQIRSNFLLETIPFSGSCQPVCWLS